MADHRPRTSAGADIPPFEKWLGKKSEMQPVVLLLSTYPFVQPRHGGQVRLANIAKAYRRAGWAVEAISVYEPESYGGNAVSSKDLAFPSDSPYRLFHGSHVPLISDLLVGAYAAAEEGGFKKIWKRIPPRIDAIHVEQPWLWPLATKIRAQQRFEDAVLVYGSQNIEAPLKHDILAAYGIKEVEEVTKAIGELERKAAQEADLVLAVTRADLNVLAGYGAQELLIAPNGIEPWQADITSIEKWRARLPEAPWMLYVASAHPPNFTGFTATVGESLACIPPDSRLVVAGSVCEHLYAHVTGRKWSALNLSRIELVGIVSDQDLAAIKTLAHAYLLPILHGGGSNLKTAEALYSGAYVIGSEAAFRGFERFTELEEVSVAHSPSEFQRYIRKALGCRPSPMVGVAKDELRQSLQWDHSLGTVPQVVAQISKSKSKTCKVSG